jgi:hypothetical protein
VTGEGDVQRQIAALARRVGNALRPSAPAHRDQALTRDYTDAERAMLARAAEHMVPVDPDAPELTFASVGGVDDQGDAELREAAVRQLATGLDIPRELLGVVDDQADAAEVAAMMARPMSVRVYEQQVDRLVADLTNISAGATLTASTHGATYAESALRLAELALGVAARLALPVDLLTHQYTPEPSEVRDLIARLGRCVAGIGHVATSVQQQLGHGYHAAARGELVGPPSSNAPAEVEAVIRDVLAVERATTEGVERATSATRRLDRLRRPATE